MKKWKLEKFEKNNPTIAVSYLSSACIWRINSNCEKQTILLMYPNEKK